MANSFARAQLFRRNHHNRHIEDLQEEAANSAERMRRHGAGRAAAAQAHLHAVAFNCNQFDIAAVCQHGGTHLGDTCP